MFLVPLTTVVVTLRDLFVYVIVYDSDVWFSVVFILVSKTFRISK